MKDSERKAPKTNFSEFLREKEDFFKKKHIFNDDKYKELYSEVQEKAAELERENPGLALAIVREQAVGNAGFQAIEGVIITLVVSAIALPNDYADYLVKQSVWFWLLIVMVLLGALCSIILFPREQAARARKAAFYAFAEVAIENMNKEPQKGKKKPQENKGTQK